MKYESFEPNGSFFMLDENTMLGQGDCLELMKHIPDGSVDMVLTDAPFGTTKCSWDSIIPFEPMWEQLKRIIKPNGAIVMTASQPFTSVLVCSNLKGFKHEWIWEKNRGSNFGAAKYQPLKEHESVLVFSKDGERVNYYPIKEPRKGAGADRVKYEFNGSNTGKREVYGGFTDNRKGHKEEVLRYPSSIQKHNTQVGLHPTQKPVALLEYLIKTYTQENETVLDFTFGSCSTGVACLNTNRKFVGIEMDEGYFDIGVKRMQESTIKGEIK